MGLLKVLLKEPNLILHRGDQTFHLGIRLLTRIFSICLAEATTSSSVRHPSFCTSAFDLLLSLDLDL